MMFNHYIPTADGSYQRRKIVPPPPVQQIPAGEPRESAKSLPRPLPSKPDLGDFLVLAILLLILIDNDDGDYLTPLITLASFILLQ